MRPHDFSYRDILVNSLAEKRRTNPRYSLRAFAKALHVSAGHLSSLMNGRKKVSQKQAVILADRLELSPEEKRAFIHSAFPELVSAEPKNAAKLRMLREDEFNLISDWYHFAILSLGSVEANRFQAPWLAQRLGISEIQARDAMNRLKRLGLVEIYRDGSYRQSGSPLTTSNDIPSRAIRNFHRQNLDLARAKLDVVPPDRREFRAVTMAINPSRLAHVKKMLRDFQSRVEKELEVGKRKAIYSFSMQLFPLSEEEGASK